MSSIINEFGGALSIGFNLLFQVFTRPGYSRWGATDDEVKRRLPGDEFTPVPRIQTTRAITIQAPPERVWPWIVQLGFGRGGLYSYELLENLAGCQMVNVDRILPELQNLRVGDAIRLDTRIPVPYTVHAIEPACYLLLAIAVDPSTNQALDLAKPVPPSHDINTWLFFLEPVGSSVTRLIIRSRHDYLPTFGNNLMWRTIVDPIHFVMERGMLKGIKNRAELFPL